MFNKSLHELPEKIVVVRSLPGLGDMLCAIPALRALRLALPDTEITLIGLNSARACMQRFCHYVDGWLEFPGFPGIPEVPFSSARTLAFLHHVQSLKFDAAVQLHGNGTYMNRFTLLLGAATATGFVPASQPCPDPDRFLPYPEHEPEIWRLLRLLEFLQIPLQGDWLEFPLQPSDWQDLEAIATAHSLRHYACIHPGASVLTRRQPPSCFAQIADALAAQGLQIVLTGTAAERDLTEAVADAMQYPAVNLAGKTSLGTIAALLKQAEILICNDTGVSHLAAALRVKSVVIFSSSDPQRWAPLDRHRHRIVQSDAGGVFSAVLAEASDLLQGEVACAS